MFQSLKKISFVLILLLLAWCAQYYQKPANMGMSGAMPTAHHEYDSTDVKTVTLSDSPRHQERVEINNSGKVIYAWVVYPESEEPTPVVLVIHENKGLTDRARQMADDIAAQWYIAIAPDLLSSFTGDKLKTSDFATEDDATKALYTLSPDTVISDLQAVYEYAIKIPSANGKVASAGFCRWWSQSFLYATANPSLHRAFVFYGTAPASGELFANIKAPVVAYYWGDDARINATISQTQGFMDQYTKQFSYQIFTGAGHAFMRRAVEPEASQANKDARTKAFASMLEELKTLK